MAVNCTNILILGAGLTGLTLAYLLRDSGNSVTVLEARKRIGGRIQTVYSEGSAPREMGATWLGRKHRSLNKLLDELGLTTFEQRLGKTAIYEPISTSPPQLVRLPANDEPSYRIQGGTAKLIETLYQKAAANTTVLLDNKATSVYRDGHKFRVATDKEVFESDIVVSTLPPYLFQTTIGCEPSLPKPLCDVMMNTHTWMGDSIKISFTFARPFWREEGLSGTIFSSVGPIPEMYDHANVADTHFALKGFFNGVYHSVTKAERCAMALKQLEKYYGPQVHDYQSYDETVWSQETFTYLPYKSHVLPHQNNGHPLYQQPLKDNCFFVAGSETASEHPGYMDGAVQSALFVAEQLL